MSKTTINKKIIDRLESELLLALFNYVVPFINKKISAIQKEKQVSNLENIINSKQKINLDDIKKLESILLKNVNKSVKVNKNVEVNSSNVSYSLNLIKQKNEKAKQSNYSISIKYEEDNNEEKIKIAIKQNEKELYSAEVINEQTKKLIVPYSLKISYETNYAEERLSISYKQQLKNYLHQHIESKEDMSNRVPLKWLNILPETMMGGVFGFTYLGENFMARRADLTGKTARMVDIHESIHTPDEYETRVLTTWIMDRIRSKYVK